MSGAWVGFALIDIGAGMPGVRDFVANIALASVIARQVIAFVPDADWIRCVKAFVDISAGIGRR